MWRMVGVSVCNQVGSVYNEGVQIRGVWVGTGNGRSVEGNRAWAEKFVEGVRKKSVQREIVACTQRERGTPDGHNHRAQTARSRLHWTPHAISTPCWSRTANPGRRPKGHDSQSRGY